MKVPVSAFAAGLLLLTLGCREDAQSPSDNEPARAVAGTPLTFRLVTTAGQHSCGVTTDSRAYCWGSNSHGELGDGTTTIRTRPVAVAGGLRFASVSAGDAFGALGDGTITNRSVPTRVAGGDHYKALSTLSHHTCGITSLDEVQCWGNNIFGQVGNNRLSAFRFPTEVTGGLRFSSLSGGIAAYHTCGIVLSGATYCWGGNNSGQLGDGTRTNHSTPAPISSPS
jgi:alpha-tubulin suppressor-like RCC1 family protein